MEKPRKNINWHTAAVAALKIDLRDYSDLLIFHREAYLWKNRFRIDLIIIHKNTDISIPKPLADQFRSVNLFEIKGIGSSVTVRSFYKTLGYAGLYASDNWTRSTYSMKDISLFLISRSYPQNLITHLQRDCGFEVANISRGIYDVREIGFSVYIIVTRMIPPEEYLYLYCVADELKEQDLQYVERLEKDYLIHHRDEPEVYGDYILQIRNAYSKAKGSATMAAAKKVKNIYDMNISELARENERQKNIYDINISELARENERQKNIYDMNISELARENERQRLENEKVISRLTEQNAREKDVFDMNISELVRENERQRNIYDMNISELAHENAKIASQNACQKREIEEAHTQVAAYKQRIAELEEQIRQLSKSEKM